MKRIEEWERAVFVATLAYNSNPYLKKFVSFDNPLVEKEKETYQRVSLEEVFPD